MSRPASAAFLALVAPVILLGLTAAGPAERGLQLTVPARPDLPVGPVAPTRPKPSPPVAFQPAPLPNRDIDGPTGPRSDNNPSVAPSLFTRGDTYRGETLSNGSSAATEQEKRTHPAAGFSLKMPFTNN